MSNSNYSKYEVGTEWESFWRSSQKVDSSLAGTGSHTSISRIWSDSFAAFARSRSRFRHLDIASGDGAVLSNARHALPGGVRQTVCVDISGAAIRSLAARYSDASGVIADASKLPFKSRSFDLVTSQFGVEYASIEGFEETARMVSRNGHLLLIVHCRPGLIYQECQTNLRAIDDLRNLHSLKRLRSIMLDGYRSANSVRSRSWAKYLRKVQILSSQLDRITQRRGDFVASGFISRLKLDLQKIAPSIQRYHRKDVLNWLSQLDSESISYRLRMKAMVGAAIDRDALNSISKVLTTGGLSNITKHALHEKADQLAWIIRAERNQ